MAIQKTTYYSSSWTAVKNFLNDNMTDPTGVSNRKWVYNRIPNTTGRNFQGYPFITIADSNIGLEGQSFSTGKKHRSFKFAITIYTLKKDNTGSTPQLDTLSDQLLSLIDAETALKNDGLHTPIVEDSPVDEGELEGEQILSRSFGLTCQNILDVS